MNGKLIIATFLVLIGCRATNYQDSEAKHFYNGRSYKIIPRTDVNKSPYRFVGFIAATRGEGARTDVDCTGIILDRSIIATQASCLYKNGFPPRPNSLSFYRRVFLSGDERPEITESPIAFVLPNQAYLSGSTQKKDDWAFLILKDTVVRTSFQETFFPETERNVFSGPQASPREAIALSYNGPGVISASLYLGSVNPGCQVLSYNAITQEFKHDCSVSETAQGAPVFIKNQSNEWTLFGITITSGVRQSSVPISSSTLNTMIHIEPMVKFAKKVELALHGTPCDREQDLCRDAIIRKVN